MKKQSMIVALTVCMVSVVSLVFFLIHTPENHEVTDKAKTANTSKRNILYWVAPMDANYRRDKPGLSPMGMELVPVYEETAQHNHQVQISAATVQNLGVRTALVSRGDFSHTINASGVTRWDESSLVMLHPRAEGWLETFNIASEGDPVVKGQVLYELFSPRLVSAQREYLTAINANNAALTHATADRLMALGFTRQQINALKQRRTIAERLPYLAQHDGVVVKLGARRGSYVKPETTIVTLASLQQIWVDVDVHETQAQWIKTRLPVNISLPALPGRTLCGYVAHIYPQLNPLTRSLRLRVVVENPGESIKPDMFASITINTTARKNILSVPTEAVIRSEAGARVIIARGHGTFAVRPVQTGSVSGQRIEILSGLDGGERIVTSGQFLLDAQANGEQAMARLTAQ